MKRLGLGIAGFGVAGNMMAEAAARSPRFKLAAVADPDVHRQAEARRAGVPTVYSQLEELIADRAIQALYLATPTWLHRRGIELAASAGLDVIVEKPLATSYDEGRVAVAAAESAQIRLIVGATRSFDAPFRWLRERVTSGDFGPLQSVTNLCATDWLLRPRTAVDLDVSRGGGIVYRQGCHQLDIVRYLAARSARSLRATIVAGDDGVQYGYNSLISFESGIVASAIYQGGGGFDSRLLTSGRGELGERIGLPWDDPRRDLFSTATVEGCPRGSAPPSFGFTLASFVEADVVPSRYGWLLLTRSGAREIRVDPQPSGWDAVLLEFESTINGETSVYDGHAGLATLELCAAVHQSNASGTDVLVGSSVANSVTSPPERSLESE